jgi:hypothetical protein
MHTQTDWRVTVEGIQAAAALQSSEGRDSLEILALVLLRYSSSSSSGSSSCSSSATATSSSSEVQQALLCALLDFRADNR